MSPSAVITLLPCMTISGQLIRAGSCIMRVHSITVRRTRQAILNPLCISSRGMSQRMRRKIRKSLISSANTATRWAIRAAVCIYIQSCSTPMRSFRADSSGTGWIRRSAPKLQMEPNIWLMAEISEKTRMTATSAAMDCCSRTVPLPLSCLKLRNAIRM
ncbi:hypothetical protein D3C75_691260 [compost metagenome]